MRRGVLAIMLPRHQPRALLGLTWGSVIGALWVCAAVVPLWVAAPFAASFTGRSGDDVWIAFERLVSIPPSHFLLLLMLTPPLVAMLLWGVRGWADRAGRARDALRWMFRAHGRLVLLFVLAWSPLTLMFTRFEALALALDLLALPAMLLGPFLLWSPHAVAAPVALRSIRPSWPGLRAVALCLGLEVVLHVLLTSIPDQDERWTEPLSILLAAVAWTVQAALWQNRAQRPWPALRASLAWPRIGACFWQIAVLQLLAIAIAIPFLLLRVFAIYVAPQIDFDSRALALEPPALLAPLAALGSWLECGYLMLLPFMLVQQLALGRLVHRSLQEGQIGGTDKPSN
jgi:hypothetical protein